MIENGMWHYDTHEIWVKVNWGWEIIWTLINPQVSEQRDIIRIKVSSAILYAIENGDENVLERMNYIYRDKVDEILEWSDGINLDSNGELTIEKIWYKTVYASVNEQWIITEILYDKKYGSMSKHFVHKVSNEDT